MTRLPVQNPELVFKHDGEEGVIFDPRTGKITHLNETAAFIYRHLDGQHTQEQIVDALVLHYAIARDQAERDLEEYLRGMLDQELIGELSSRATLSL